MTTTRREFLAGTAGAALATFVITPGAARAQGAWPSQPITLVVMYGQGGGTDTVLRTLAAEMAAAKGWTVNVINQPGAVGAVATEYVAGREADGHWLLGAANFNKFVRVMGHTDAVPWENWSFLQAATALASWAVPMDSPFETMADVVAAAQANPGNVTISTSGTGGIWHELALIVADAAGIELGFVPYEGGRAATLAGLQGEVDIAGGGVHEHVDLIRAGQMRCLQQCGVEDIVLDGGQVMPSVAGALPGLVPLLPLGPQYNLILRRDTAPDVQAEIEEAFRAAVASDAFQAIAAEQYFEIEILSGEAADRRAALLEAVTAATFTRFADQIGVPVRSPADLGLPEPAAFDAWWPPQGYTPVAS